MPEENLPDYSEFDHIHLVNGDQYVDAVIVARIGLEGGNYALIHPLDDPNIGAYECLVFELSEGEDGDIYRIVTDEDIIDSVFEEYNRIQDSQE